MISDEKIIEALFHLRLIHAWFSLGLQDNTPPDLKQRQRTVEWTEEALTVIDELKAVCKQQAERIDELEHELGRYDK